MIHAKVNEVVLPGDVLKNIDNKDSKFTVILGPGLRRDGDLVYACKAGLLRKRSNIYYVDSYQKRYVDICL